MAKRVVITPVSSGGGSGDVATDAIWNAAGDLAVGTGVDTATRLAIGTAGQVLKVNAGATALEWGTASGTGDALVSGTLAQFASTTSSQLRGVISDETGTGSLVFATSPTLVTPALGTPSSGTLTSCTGYVVGNISGLGTGVATFLATPSSANLASAVTDETGSGALVFATSPTLVTPTLGVASATTINKVTLTAPATGSTVTIADGKTFTSSNTLTLTGTDGSTLNVGTGGTLGTAAYTATTAYAAASHAHSGSDITSGTVGPTFLGSGSSISTKFLRGDSTWQTISGGGDALTSGNLSQFAATTSAQLAGVISDETGSGALVFATSPTLTTPTIGVATATSINKVAVTAPATSATLTIADGKTLTASNTLTLTGTDSSSIAFGAGGTVIYSGGALGTPSSGTLTSCTGLPISTGVSGLGTGVATALAVAVGSAGAPVVLNGAGGTPSSLTLTNASGLPVSGITASTSTALGVGSLELGHASDTTLARASAGVVTIEGVNIVTTSSSDTLTNKTLTSPTINTGAFGTSLTGGADAYIVFDEHSSAPSTSASGSVRLYAKADGLLYSKDDAGTETLVSGGAGGGGSSDFLSILTSAEIAITDATTAPTIGRMHAYKATSADRTVVLPTAASQAGKFIGIRITTDTTKLFTFDGNSTETIDGAATRIMWAGESAILMSDGTNWFKIAGKSIPMSAKLKRNSAATIGNASLTKVLLDSTVLDNMGAMADPTTNNRINIKRTGFYEVSGCIRLSNITGVVNTLEVQIFVNGSSISSVNGYAAVNAFPSRQSSISVSLTAGDYVSLHAYQDVGSTQDYYVAEPHNWLAVNEVVLW